MAKSAEAGRARFQHHAPNNRNKRHHQDIDFDAARIHEAAPT